jgi:hypothetical protein
MSEQPPKAPPVPPKPVRTLSDGVANPKKGAGGFRSPAKSRDD